MPKVLHDSYQCPISAATTNTFPQLSWHHTASQRTAPPTSIDPLCNTQPLLPLEGQGSEAKLQFHRLCMMHREKAGQVFEKTANSCSGVLLMDHVDQNDVFIITHCLHQKTTDTNTSAAHHTTAYTREPCTEIAAHIQLKN